MSTTTFAVPKIVRLRGLRAGGALSAILLLATACGASDTGSGARATDDGAQELLIATQGFPCGLNDGTKLICEGFEAGAEQVPAGFEVDVITGSDYTDNTAYNNLLENALELRPAGIVVWPGGGAAQAPVVEKACAAGVKVILLDALEGADGCWQSLVGNDQSEIGVMAAEWLIANPPTSKEVGIAMVQPGQAVSSDERVEAFTRVVTEAGYEVVAEVVGEFALDQTRNAVTNMLTAHPNIGAIFSTTDWIGDGVAQAVGDKDIVQLTSDGFLNSIKRIPTGGLDVDIAQNGCEMGRQAVLTLVKAVEGDEVPLRTTIEPIVVDSTNAQEIIAQGGTPCGSGQ